MKNENNAPWYFHGRLLQEYHGTSRIPCVHCKCPQKNLPLLDEDTITIFVRQRMKKVHLNCVAGIWYYSHPVV